MQESNILSELTRSGGNSGKLVALSAPSGAGKSTICKLLLERNRHYRLSISATTRKPRRYEQDGIHYYFLSETDFLKSVERGDFLEYEEVHGNYYGTLKSMVSEFLAEGLIVLFDIDVNGALNIKKQHPDALLIFIKPPSVEELKRRLTGRKTEDPAVIEKRLQRLPMEYEKASAFDYQVINDDLQRVVSEIEQLIENWGTS